MTPTLLEIKQRCEEATSTQFNSVLVNLYRDGQDSMGLHADDEPELGVVLRHLRIPRDAHRTRVAHRVEHRHAGVAIRVGRAVATPVGQAVDVGQSAVEASNGAAHKQRGAGKGAAQRNKKKNHHTRTAQYEAGERVVQ